jgi:hypothetical protein
MTRLLLTTLALLLIPAGIGMALALIAVAAVLGITYAVLAWAWDRLRNGPELRRRGERVAALEKAMDLAFQVMNEQGMLLLRAEEDANASVAALVAQANMTVVPVTYRRCEGAWN